MPRPAALCQGFGYLLRPLRPSSMLDLAVSKRRRPARSLVDRGRMTLPVRIMREQLFQDLVSLRRAMVSAIAMVGA
jgi:hypothetical protein